MSTVNRPWDAWAERILIHTPHYLSYDGKPSVGGRERYIRDVATLIRDRWRRPVVVVQLGRRSFEAVCPDGLPVIGRRGHVEDARGEPGLALWLDKVYARRSDAIVYAAGEMAWPFFRPGSKGIQHGIWWDGPLSLAKRLLQRRRVLSFARAMRSTLCVDTNYINGLRGMGVEGLELAKRCSYLPNYVDTDALPAPDPDRGPGDPIRILYARRFHPCRGPMLFLDTLAALRKRGFPFHATMYTVGGEAELVAGLRERGIEQSVTVASEGLDGILATYAHHDVAVVPTLWSEGTSFAAVEALCAGLPVVTTPVGGLANVVVPGFNGAVTAPTAEALADGVVRCADPEAWRRLHRNALSMRESLGVPRWRDQVFEWVKA